VTAILIVSETKINGKAAPECGRLGEISGPWWQLPDAFQEVLS